MENETPKQLLQLYCQRNGFDVPEYECQRTRFKKYIGTVCVGGVKYPTDPFDYDTELRAENEAAKIALGSFKNKVSKALDSDERIAQKMYNCIVDNGVILKYLPNVFK